MLADHYPRYVRVYRSFSVNNTSINDHLNECICPHKKTNLGTQLLQLYGSCERFLCSKVKFDIPWDTLKYNVVMVLKDYVPEGLHDIGIVSGENRKQIPVAGLIWDISV